VRRIEVAPIMSDYPMYATTYASPEEFEARNPLSPTYHFAVKFDDGVEQHASELFERLELDGPVRDAYLDVVEKRERTSAAAAIAEAERQLTAHFGRRVTAIIVSIDERGFDWNKGRFYWKAIRKRVHAFETM
jgi:hypothetical protein